MQEAFKAAGHVMTFMDVWTLQEIQSCRALMYSHLLAEDVELRFDKWGGIPRYVLEKVDSRSQDLLEEAIGACSVHLIQQSLGASSAHAEVSDRILHLRVQAESEYGKTSTDWASPWVAERVAYELWRQQQADLQMFVCAAVGMGELGGVRGHLWEGLCHARLAAGGSFRCRDLQTPDSIPVALELQPALTRKVFDDWHSIQHCSTGTYCRPRQKNNAAVDAALRPDVLFQITVSKRHPINCAGLATAVSGMSQQGCIKLYFVVPSGVFSEFTEQPIKQGPGVQQLRQRVKQYALEIPYGTVQMAPT